MCHPWVADEGRAPLRSCADLGLGSIEVTTQEQLGAIDRASVVSMIRARLKEKVFRSNDYLFQAVRNGCAAFKGTPYAFPIRPGLFLCKPGLEVAVLVCHHQQGTLTGLVIIRQL
jgi:hypothetical protein